MKTSDKTTPAVSQLAGEISRMMRIKIHDLWEHTGPQSPSDPSNKRWLDEREKQDAPAIEKLISAALSEREEKIAKLIEAVKDDICSAPCGPMCCGKLRAALSALGESKDHFLDSK